MNYPAIGVVFGILQKAVPSITKKRKQHMKFTDEKLQKRLDLNTDRKDVIAYVNLIS
jgi:hypothetical protein